VELESRVAYASIGTVEAYSAEAGEAFDSAEWTLSFLWNTGRGSSTLLQKSVMAAGGVSLCEPHWLDQLCHWPMWKSAPPTLPRVLRTCVLVEALLARRQRSPSSWGKATCFTITPKCGGMHVAEAAAAVFPLSRHVMLHSPCDKAVDTLVSLDNGSNTSTFSALRTYLSWWWYGIALVPPVADATLQAAVKSGGLPLAKLSRLAIATKAADWIDTVRGWTALQVHWPWWRRRMVVHGGGGVRVNADEAIDSEALPLLSLVRALRAGV